jgi:hypothetical protein
MSDFGAEFRIAREAFAPLPGHRNQFEVRNFSSTCKG